NGLFLHFRFLHKSLLLFSMVSTYLGRHRMTNSPTEAFQSLSNLIPMRFQSHTNLSRLERDEIGILIGLEYDVILNAINWKQI
ncbi:MAG TPA: hypothetical protein PLE74_12145, partial [Candidatus Cloacimonadota bacterium]|nr:hypothetical protein [Candidatus Cloacimonadota bacterium]